MAGSTHPWWKEASIYQVYPASFQDSNGDGIGDLPGVLSRIDYIKDTGADAIWICPMYNSPQKDMGYDISDYENVYPPYGTVEDMDAIIVACHERGMKLLLDLVINHTSDEHAWFKESRSSKDSPKRDWYIWRPARHDAQGNRRPPNNWSSHFGGSAWEWDEGSQEYYLHLFAREQPDLNWENEETRKAIYETSMHFWLRKGVDGFRVDTVNLYSKVPGLPDAPFTDPTSEYQFPEGQVSNGPRIHEFLGEMNAIFAQYGATMTMGELGPTSNVRKYVSAAAKQLDMAIQFDLVNVGFGPDVANKYNIGPEDALTLPAVASAVASIQGILADSDGWVTTYLENHDQPRSVSRWGSDLTDESRVRSAKLLAMFQATLSGTILIYQGQEIGVTNAPKEWSMEEYKDVASIDFYEGVKAKTGGDPKALARAFAGLQCLARDHSRIPMSWDASPNAGFTNGEKPWMRVHDNYALVNVENQLSDENSVRSFWKKMLRFRKEHADLLVHGIYKAVQDKDLNVLIYEKHSARRKAIVALNFSGAEQPVQGPPSIEGAEKGGYLSTYGDLVEGNLRAYEGRVWIGSS
ncbi:alpha-glucosidase [Trichoderma gamsii]|uniref:Alpha-glucosidase n=1 Tax=Trichoderma gamsii TaxID=398673 RepID=A0A2P4Z793_9HYPO|nr:alpha-glucosidase [Trichoderma gamsii]PON20154.1 alpha-glucosidase [Trichoderma gamsii]